MKRFDKNKQLRKLHNRKNNNSTKIISIFLSITILIGAIIYFTFARFESNATFNLINGNVVPPVKTIAESMVQLKSVGSSDLMYDGIDSLGDSGTADNNLRYVGANPNNYVYFNCSTINTSEMNDSTCEKWRIIGLFNNIEDENRNNVSLVKIIRAESLGNYSWDTSESSINSGDGINQWGASGNYEGADLMRELNTDYLGNITVGTDGKWYNESSNTKTADMPASSLNVNAQNMINTVVWNLGTPSINNGEFDSNFFGSNGGITTSTSYIRERLDTNLKICTSGTYCNDSVVRTQTWTGKIGLIYTSDYLYATSGGEQSNIICLNASITGWSNMDECKNNDWLLNSSQFTISSFEFSNYSNMFIDIDSRSFIWYARVSSPLAVYPALYLNNNIYINSGDGSENNPYKLIQK